jgi:hypothetical protein
MQSSFPGLINPKNIPQLADCAIKVTKMLVTCLRFVLAKLVEGILPHCHVLAQCRKVKRV